MDSKYRRIITVREQTAIVSGTLCIEAIAELQKRLKVIPDDYQNKTSIELDVNEDDLDPTVYLEYERFETTTEKEERLIAEVNSIKHRVMQNTALNEVYEKMFGGGE